MSGLVLRVRRDPAVEKKGGSFCCVIKVSQAREKTGGARQHTDISELLTKNPSRWEAGYARTGDFRRKSGDWLISCQNWRQPLVIDDLQNARIVSTDHARLFEDLSPLLI
jgi:hypothetical protein